MRRTRLVAPKQQKTSTNNSLYSNPNNLNNRRRRVAFSMTDGQMQEKGDQKNKEFYKERDEVIKDAMEKRKEKQIQVLNPQTGYFERITIDTSIEDYTKYGIGVYLFFDFLRCLSWAFLILSILSIPKLIIYSFGDGLSEEQSLPFYIKWSLANLSTDGKANIDGVVGDYKRSVFITTDFLFYLVFNAFLLFYMWRINHKTKEIEMKEYTLVDYAIKIENLPSEVKFKKIDQKFTKYGPIVQIYILRKVSKILESFKEIDKKKKKIEKLLKKCKDQKKFVKAMKQLEELNIKLDQMAVDKQKVEPLMVFITFEYPISRINALRDFERYKTGSCLRGKKSTLKLNGGDEKSIWVSTSDNPLNINYENLEYTSRQKFWRSVLVMLISAGLILFALGMSIMMFAYTRTSTSLPCEQTYTQEEYDALAESNDITEEVTRCYCNTLKPNQQLEDKRCTEIVNKRIRASIITFLVGCITFMTNFVLKWVMTKLTKYQKFYTKSEEIASFTSKLFISLFINTAIIQLLANADIFGLQPSIIFYRLFLIDSEEAESSILKDFTKSWYMRVGSAISNTMIVNIFSPQVTSVIITFATLWIKKWAVRRKFFKGNVEKTLQPLTFEIHYRYSYIMMTIFTSMMYVSMMPYLIIFAFFTIFLSYYCHKVNF